MFSNRFAGVWATAVLMLAVTACSFLRAPDSGPTPAGMAMPRGGMLPASLGPANQTQAQVEEVYRCTAPAVV